MSSSADASARGAALHSEDLSVAAEAFWRAKLDDDLPRAQIVRDFKREAGEVPTYRDVEFELEPGAAMGLGKLAQGSPSGGIAVGASLLAMLFAKYQRHDAVIVGFRMCAGPGGSPAILPLRVVCESESSLLAVIKAVEAEIAALLTHPAPSRAGMARILGVESSAGTCPFFDVVLAVDDAEPAVDLTSYPVDVAFLLEVAPARFRGRIRYAADLFEPARVERLASHLVNLAGQAAREPGARLADLSVLSVPERQHLLVDFLGRSVAFPLHRTLHGLFEEQARRTPDRIAALHGTARVSYVELDRRANRLANALRAAGLGRGEFVSILLDRGIDFLTAMLGIFKAGGAYVPLDPTYPRDRIHYMLNDSETEFVVTNAAIAAAFGDVLADSASLGTIVCVAGEIDVARLPRTGGPLTLVGPDALAGASEREPGLSLSGVDRAYMIYTSGSTGRPKGAICRHDGALNHLYGEVEGLELDLGFNFLQSAASSSDISVWQFLAPLVFGGATVIVDYDVVVDPAQLFAAMRDQRVTVAELVPVVLRALLDYVTALPAEERRLPDLRVMMSTGEALAGELVERWLSLYPRIPMANTYGPTETSDDVTLVVLREPLGPGRSVVPIGRPLPNVSIFILDGNLCPVPLGVPGEICIGGIGVGEGYWRQPEKTAVAFVTAPLPEAGGGLIYRTGDLGMWRSDGTIEFLGRIDQQVKVRGFRVEPGEIEAVMTQHPAVQDAVVVAVPDGAGTNRLVGYFVPHRDRSVDVATLRQFLKGSLADHMIPAVLVARDALPLTPLGKVDRKTLSRPDLLPQVERENYVAPRDDLEGVLARAWSAVLGQQQIGIHDNYFEIGGDSILTIYVIAQLRGSGLTVLPKDFFLHPTIADLARWLRSDTALRGPAGPGGASVGRAEPPWDVAGWRRGVEARYPDLEDIYPLAQTQRGIYLQSLMLSRASGAYVEQVAFDLIGDLRTDLLAQAWQHAVDTIDVLRSAVVRQGVGQPVQVLLRSAPLALETQDWCRLSTEAQNQAREALTLEERRQGFDLRRPPLMRVVLVRLGDRRWHLLWTYHHIILDGWSETLVLESVFRAYDELLAGRRPALVPREQFRRFVAWAETQDLAAAEDFWRRQLSGFESPVGIPGSAPKPEPPERGELSHGWLEMTLSETEAAQLDGLAKRRHVTLGTVIHGAWALLLHRRSGSEEVVFGSIASGRQSDLPGADTIPGVLVVAQPLRTRVAADTLLGPWLRDLQLQMAEIREFEQTPLSLIQQWSDVPPEKRPLFDTIVVMANYLGADLAHLHPTGIQLAEVSYVTQPLYPLTLFVVPGGARLSLRLVHDKRRYDAGTVRGILDELGHLLASMAGEPEVSLGALRHP